MNRIHWTDEEWLLVAQALATDMPELIAADSLLIPAAAIRKAMTALPATRHRTVGRPHQFYAGLTGAFKTLAEARQDFKDHPEHYHVPKADPNPNKVSLKGFDALDPHAKAVIGDPLPTATTVPLAERFMAAATPLLSFLIDLIAERMQPGVVDAMAARAKESLGQAPVAPIVTQLAPGPGPDRRRANAHCAPPSLLVPGVAPLENDTTPSAPKPRKAPAPTEAPAPRRVVIGILGGLPQLADDLRASFPQFEFVHRQDASSGAKAVAALKSADRVIAITKFMGHGGDKALAKTFGKNYHRIAGAVSDAKRLIQIWINGGEFAQ